MSNGQGDSDGKVASALSVWFAFFLHHVLFVFVMGVVKLGNGIIFITVDFRLESLAPTVRGSPRAGNPAAAQCTGR
jgi:hypothetical protein